LVACNLLKVSIETIFDQGYSRGKRHYEEQFIRAWFCTSG
jgi:hypothetical protein